MKSMYLVCKGPVSGLQSAIMAIDTILELPVRLSVQDFDADIGKKKITMRSCNVQSTLVGLQ